MKNNKDSDWYRKLLKILDKLYVFAIFESNRIICTLLHDLFYLPFIMLEVLVTVSRLFCLFGIECANIISTFSVCLKKDKGKHFNLLFSAINKING